MSRAVGSVLPYVKVLLKELRKSLNSRLETLNLLIEKCSLLKLKLEILHWPASRKSQTEYFYGLG